MVYDLNGTTLSTGGSGMLNVLDHGFKGDGITDNLAAFNALIAAHPADWHMMQPLWEADWSEDRRARIEGDA